MSPGLGPCTRESIFHIPVLFFWIPTSIFQIPVSILWFPIPKPEKLSPKVSPGSILEHFGHKFGSYFQWNSWFLCAKTTEMLIYKAFRWIQHIQKLTFSELISIKISNFFWCLILDVMFWDFGASWCQNSWFWEPLGGQRCPNWRPRSPKWYPKGCAAHLLLTLFGSPRRSWFNLFAYDCLLAHSVIDINGGRPKAALVGLRFTCPWWAAKGRPCGWTTDCYTFVFFKAGGPWYTKLH